MTTEPTWRTDYHRQKEAEADKLRAEARRLRAQGWSFREIAEALNRCIDTVRDYCLDRAHESRAVGSVWPVMRWEEKAELMAAVYDDPERQNWILKQMGVERDGGT